MIRRGQVERQALDAFFSHIVGRDGTGRQERQRFQNVTGNTRVVQGSKEWNRRSLIVEPDNVKQVGFER
jgi:hypothetical protein